MWTVMPTSIYADLSCHSTTDVEVTDLRQPLGFPARFQKRSNRSSRKRKTEASIRLTSLTTQRLMKKLIFGSHACRNNQHFLFSRKSFPRFFPVLLQPLILTISPCTPPHFHVSRKRHWLVAV